LEKDSERTLGEVDENDWREMSDNFHSKDCALRYHGDKCTCGYVKSLTKQEKEIAKLKRAHDEMEAVIGELRFNDTELRTENTEMRAQLEYIKKWAGQDCLLSEPWQVCEAVIRMCDDVLAKYPGEKK
jgi:hypothetical protein